MKLEDFSSVKVSADNRRIFSGEWQGQWPWLTTEVAHWLSRQVGGEAGTPAAFLNLPETISLMYLRVPSKDRTVTFYFKKRSHAALFKLTWIGI